MKRNEITTLLKFLSKLRKLFNTTVSEQTIDDDWRIFSYVFLNHLENRICTTTSIIQASGLPFATGLRKVNKLIKEKKLIKRSKTKSGKSFSIHPSEDLIKGFTKYLLTIKSEFALKLGYSEIDNNFYFGTSISAANIISAPSVVINKNKKYKKIRFLSNDNPTFKVIKKNLDFFQHIFNSQIELNIEGDLKKLLNKIITNSQSNIKSKFDIIAFNIPWIGQLVNLNCLTPLDKYVEDIGININDFYYSGIHSCTYKKQLFGIPIEAIPELLFYRKDIFEKHKIKPPTNYEELLSACKILKNSNEIESPISWPAKKGQDLARSFIITMANFGKPYINLRHIGSNVYDLDSEKISLKANFLSDAAFKAAKILKELVSYSPSNIAGFSNDICVEYYSQGKSAMVINWSSRAHLFELNNESPAYHKTSYLPRPAGHPLFQVSPIGGFSLGIPSNVSEEKIPYILSNIRKFVSPEVVKYYIENGSLSSPIFSVVNDPEVKAISPIFKEIDKMEKEEKIIEWATYPIPAYSKIIEEIGEIIFEYLFLNKDLKTVLETCQKSAQKYLS